MPRASASNGPGAANSVSTRRCRPISRPSSISWLCPGLRQREARPAQGARQPDQRKTDECRRVGGLDALEKGRPHGLGLEAAGTIEGPLALDVARDLV